MRSKRFPLTNLGQELLSDVFQSFYEANIRMLGRVCQRRILGLREFCTWLWLIFGCSRQLLKNKFFDLSTPKRKVDNIGKQMGGGTLGSGTMVCDTSTHKDHFTVKWFQNYFFYLIPHIIKVFLEFCI